MKLRAVVLYFTLVITLLGLSSHVRYNPDMLLGEGYEVHTFEMEEDYSGRVVSTLIRRAPLVDSRRAVLYIHGFNDYFFQDSMARRFNDSMYNFYAVDLRKYGRSWLDGQSQFEVRRMDEYFADIDSALMVVRSEGAEQVILMGHSTGGLTAQLYCMAHNESPKVEGVVLNSPFLDMNLPPITENILVPLVSLSSYISRKIPIPSDASTAYYESLHRDYHGEWLFDDRYKIPRMEYVTAGWIAAIHDGHERVQSGEKISLPLLLAYSDNSLYGLQWREDFQHGDAVLSVDDIKRYGSQLSDSVVEAMIEGGMHDLALSSYRAREEYYKSIFSWLRSINKKQENPIPKNITN